jgi:DNA polymerase I-like protein with 3'-5' exonuclease and polymerase domains
MNRELKVLVPEELNPKLNYLLVVDELGLEKVQEFLNQQSVFALDIETNMVDDFTDRKIRTIQLGNRAQQFIIDLLPFASRAGLTLEQAMADPYKPHACLQPVIDIIKPAFESRKYKKIGHFIQFDYETIKYCLGIRTTNMYCTFQSEKLIYAGSVQFQISGFWALDDLVRRYLGLIISKEEQTKFDLVTPLTESQQIYCALDCRLPMGVVTGQTPALESGKLLKALEIENGCIGAMGDMFLNGMNVNKKKWLRVVHKYKVLHKRHIAKLDEFFIPIVGRKEYDDTPLTGLEQKWREEKDKEIRATYRKEFMAARKKVNELKKNFKHFPGHAAINYASPVALFNVIKQLPRFIEANKLAAAASGKRQRGVPWFRGTDDRTLKIFSEHPDWDVKTALRVNPDYSEVGMMDALRLYRETEKLLNSYGADWLRKNVNKKTGRVHGRITQIGADTGRSSCKNPNMQQLPRAEEWRSCFTAPTGKKIITLDYSGAELVILADLSQDPIFVHAYKNGWDVHSVVAEIVFKDEWLASTVHEATEIDGKKIPKCAYYYDSGKGDHKKCKCPRHNELRTKAKPCGLGMAYGMEAQKLADAIGVTYEEAEIIIKKFRDSFPTLIIYLAKSGNDTKDTLESRSLSGRRRIFNKPSYKDAATKAKRKLEEKGIKDKAPSRQQVSWALHSMYSAIEREGKNNPLQASNADISKLAMGDLTLDSKCDMMWCVLETKYNAKLVLFVHDEFVIEVDESVAEECAAYVEKAAIAAAADLIKSVPMGVEFSIEGEWKK